MGFYTTDERAAVLEPCQENLIPPSKNRVWNFFATSETCTGFSESQPVESHWEKWPTPTKTVSGVRYYGYRYYVPETGRWTGRDSLQESGDINIFAFVNNDPQMQIDALGEKALTVNKSIIIPSSCGGYDAYGEFEMSSSDIGGWILQHVHIEQTITVSGLAAAIYDPDTGTKYKCNCCSPIKPPKTVIVRSFDEAFPVKAITGGGGLVIVHDASAADGGFHCKSGSEMMKKTAIFKKYVKVNSEGCPPGFRQSKGPPDDPIAKGHCVKDTKVNDYASDPAALIWGIQASWDCCPKYDNATTASWL